MPVFPKNIIFVIDKSGSMVGNKIRQVISPKTEPFLEPADSFLLYAKFNSNENYFVSASQHQIFSASSLFYICKSRKNNDVLESE